MDMTVAERGPGPLQMKFEQWPRLDRDLWNNALRPTDILDEPSAASGWAEGTRKTLLKAYGRWLGWLEAFGLLDSACLPADRVTREKLALFMAALQEHGAPRTVWHYVHGLAMTLAAMQPDAKIGWLWEVVNHLNRTSQPIRRKRDRIVPAKDLFEFGMSLMAAPPPPDPLMAAVQYRDGLVVALLAARPIRMRNLHMMEFDKHLVRVGDAYWLRFESQETKTHRAMNLPVPAALSEPLDIYATIHRPLLLAKNAPARLPFSDDEQTRRVWITRFGTPMAETSLFKRISELTEERFGRPINPHLFRDCAATSIALDDPDHIHVTMGVLGHSSLATSERYYNHARTREAVNLNQRAIAALRRGFCQQARLGKKRLREI